jgi:hypothetical protein
VDASWRCPSSYYGAYYPSVIRCWDWQWDANRPDEQAAAAEAQRAAAQRAEAQRAAAEAQRATELARIEAEREATKARMIAAARVAAENSPDNMCHDPKIARIMMEAFNHLDWADGRKVVDIEHLVTLVDQDQNKSCHGVWDLENGRKIEGTLTLKTNVAGDPIAHWQVETWQPTISVTAKPEIPIVPAAKPETPTVVPTSGSQISAFRDGAADRAAWENWFGGLVGDERDGALYWASQRSLPSPGSCATLSGAKALGCREAQTRLSPSDARRKTEPEYKAGWNSIQAS